ncbi:hypothetical protein K1W54_14860 [Micromonospora sp. CPCC 205371]|nr:hypothetical protein [Micromonospora sp. CPCC 205371]
MTKVADGEPIEDRLSDDDLRGIIEEFWNAIRDLLAKYQAEQLERGEEPVTVKQIADFIGMSDRTLGDWLREGRVVKGWDKIGEVVAYLGGAEDEWRSRWRRARAAYEDLGRRHRSRPPEPAPVPV